MTTNPATVHGVRVLSALRTPVRPVLATVSPPERNDGAPSNSPALPSNRTVQPLAALKPRTEFAGLRCHPVELTSVDEMADVVFHEVINAEIKLGTHLYSRIAVAQVTATTREVIIFVDRSKSSADEVAAVIEQIEANGYVFPSSANQVYFAAATLIISMSQGHLNSSILKSARDIKRDPTRNALFQTFTEIVGWAYDAKANDIDWAVDITSSSSQICFKIGGRYVRPERWRMQTDTMIHVLGIAWQRGGGGAAPQFDWLQEQQAQITLDLPKTETRKAGAKVRLRWSGMSNDKGTVVTMRVQPLGASTLVHSLDEAGYLPYHMTVFERVLKSEGGMVCFSGVVGSGKSTSLARLIGMLPDYLKIQSIEDPVELEIERAYQKTVARDMLSTGVDPAFVSASRAIYRSALDVLYLGEIRDTQTGGIAREVLESGHSVYTTTHARSSLGTVERLVSPQIGIPRDVLGAPDILKLLVYQALLPLNCRHCAKSPAEYASAMNLGVDEREKLWAYFDRIERLFHVSRETFRLRDHHGCPHCRKDGLPELNGLSGRTVVCEMAEPDERMVELILDGRAINILRYWRSMSDGKYDTPNMMGKTAMECAFYKAVNGLIDPREIEERFQSFETLEIKMALARQTSATH